MNKKYSTQKMKASISNGDAAAPVAKGPPGWCNALVRWKGRR